HESRGAGGGARPWGRSVLHRVAESRGLRAAVPVGAAPGPRPWCDEGVHPTREEPSVQQPVAGRGHPTAGPGVLSNDKGQFGTRVLRRLPQNTALDGASESDRSFRSLCQLHAGSHITAEHASGSMIVAAISLHEPP